MEKGKRRIIVVASLVAALITGGVLAIVFTQPERKAYSIVILGDTHFDAEPDSVYHSNYSEPVKWLNNVQRAEFARNGEMWRERCPRLLQRAAQLVGPDTRMIFQMGDLIQGDCGTAEVHRKMLGDVMDYFKAAFGGLPFITVAGNHDVRGNYTPEGTYDRWGRGAEVVYDEFMPERMSAELGMPVGKTTFSFFIGPDAYIFIDFNTPDDAEIERLLCETEGARYTFVVSHGPLLPYGGSGSRWFLHGWDNPSDNAARVHFRELFAQRNVICLCGHIHTTELADWYGDGGRITQMTMNSVWESEESGVYTVDAQGPEEFPLVLEKARSQEEESDLCSEYADGIRRYTHSPSAGVYKLHVTPRRVWVDFFAGDSGEVSASFLLR